MTIPRPRRVPPGWVLAAGCLAAAACIALSTRYQKDQQADSLIPVLCSLYGWTPFYWEQDRLGMLVPLLARPFTHPLTNLLVQSGVTIALGLAALAAVPWYLLRGRTAAPAGAAGAALFLAACPPSDRFQALNGT